MLAEKRSLVSREALVSLVSYKLDAGLSEGFNCYILEKGQAAIGDLKRVESKNFGKVVSVNLQRRYSLLQGFCIMFMVMTYVRLRKWCVKK